MLRTLIFGTRHPRQAAGAVAAASGAARLGPTPGAVDEGIHRCKVQELVDANADILARIKLCYGRDRAAFERDIMGPVRAYASYVNALPATADNYFAVVGGLFRLGLEAGFFALQGSDGHIVSGSATISVRSNLEPRWRYACFLAGLTVEVHRTLSLLVVADEQGNTWPRYMTPLTPWLETASSPRFFVRWLNNASSVRALGVFALPHILGAEVMQYLDTGNAIVVPQLMSCLAGMPLSREANPLDDVVSRAAAMVIHRDLVANASRYGRPMLGAHLERYLLDAMRRLVMSKPSWQPNAHRSRVWLGQEGLFVVWPNGAEEMLDLLREDRIVGIPQAPDTLLEILLAAKIVVPPPPGQARWWIRPPGADQPLPAVKVFSPELLLSPFQDAAALSQPPKVVVAAPDARGRAAPAAAPSDSAPAATAATAATAANVEPALADSSGSVAQTLPLFAEVEAVAAPSSSGMARTSPATDDVASPPAGLAPPKSSADAAPQLRLRAPMRLHPLIATALAAAVDSMNGPAAAAIAITVPAGVLVRLDALTSSGLDVQGVLRGLADAGMAATIRGDRAVPVQRDWGGSPVLGVVVKPGFVNGLDPSLFAVDGSD